MGNTHSSKLTEEEFIQEMQASVNAFPLEESGQFLPSLSPQQTESESDAIRRGAKDRMSHDIIRSDKYHTTIYNPGSGFEANMTTSSRPIQITANRLKPLQFHDDVNNCTDDNARHSEGKSGPPSKPDRASRPTPVWGKQQSKAKERTGSIFRKAGVQKRKKGCAYLSPRIERKATDARESCSRLTLHTDVVTNSLDVQSEMTTAVRNLKSSDTDCRHNPNESTSAEKTHAHGVRVRSSDKKISNLERKSKVRSAEFRQDAEQQQPENANSANSAEDNANATGESVQGTANRDSRLNPYCTVQVEKEVYEGKVPSGANSTRQRGSFWTSLGTILKSHEDDTITDEINSTPQDSDATEGLLHPSLETEASFTPDPVSVGSFLSSDEQGDLRADVNVPPTKPYTIDKFKVQQILDILKDSYTTPVEGKGPGWNGLRGRSDSSLTADLKCIEQELLAIAELDSLRKKPEVQGSGFWKWKTKESKQDRKEERSFEGFQRAQTRTESGRRGQGDCQVEIVPTISQDKLSGIHERRSVPQPREEVVCTAPKQNELRFRSTSSKRRKKMDSETTRGETPGRNTNESMSRSRSSAQFNIPALQPHKWRCRSAHELRHPLSRLEPLRSVSQYDVPIAHRCDVKGPFIMEVGSDSDHEAVPSLLWGEEAYRHYKLLTMIETKEKIQMIKDAKATIVTKYMWKQRVLQNLVDVAKAYYSDPTNDKRREWKRLREEIHHSKDHSMTDIRNTVAEIPNFLPFFTLFLMMAQAVCVVAMSSAGGLAPTGVLSTMEIRRDIQTFLGAETLHRYVIPNPWIGPPVTILLASGASFAPCLRRDQYVAKQGEARKFQKINDEDFGCCQMRGPLNAAGTTTQAECARYTNNAGVWGPPYCSLRPPGNNSVAHVIRPCCTDHRGTCQMLSHQHCAFLKGYFHIEKEHCVQVFCLRDVCTMGHNLFRIDSDPDMPWLARKRITWQWWRPLLSQFYTFGFMHCLPLMLIEWLLMRPFEESAGWFRVMIIYTICGLVGQLVEGLVDPTIPHVGSTSGVAGIIGEAAVELSQAWKLLDKPDTEAIKLGSFMLLLLLMGMLPYVSFLGCLAGCGCGTICAVVFMPYITFDRWDICRKITLVIVGVTMLVLIISILLYAYITLQPLTCQACRKLECLSFTDNMCNMWDLLG